MSKLYSSIQRAIDKSRVDKRSAKSNSPEIAKHSHDEESSIIHRTNPNTEVMQESHIVAATENQVARTAYNVLRARVLQRMRGNNWQSILVTSPQPGDGKTLTAINLAMSLSRDVNQSTILVDLDLTRSSVAKYLGINVEIKAGIGDYLLGTAEAEDIMYSPDDYDRLLIVPNREPVSNSSDLIGGPRMKEFVARIRAQGEKSIVIFDMPPVLAGDDVLTFCPNVDAILLVVAQGQTKRTELERSISLLAEFEILGVVLNKSDESANDTSYAYY